MKSLRLKPVAASLAGVAMLGAVLGSAPAMAFPAATKAEAGTAAGDVSPVYWRRGWGWWGPGPAVAVLGGVIVGGAIVASAVAEHRAAGVDMRRCADEFRSFDPRSGTYVDRFGEVRVCPYLY